MSEHTVTLKHYDIREDIRGNYEFPCKRPAGAYFGYGELERVTLAPLEILQKDARYIAWMDRTGLYRSYSKMGPQALRNKKSHRDEFRFWYPHGFDHTTMWRRKGERQPCLLLTEPYVKPTDQELAVWDDYTSTLGLEYTLIEPSPKSLWYPDSTWMIFWWNPDKMAFDDFLMDHPDADEVHATMRKL